MMQARLNRFLEDRTRMLAAISHDLRTPITLLRLRAEFIEDAEEQRRIKEILDDMETMVSTTLSFAHEQENPEPGRRVDIIALVESLCDELADAGRDVVLVGGNGGLRSAVLWCRPVSFKRALSNVLDNAIKYGRRARVELSPLNAPHATGERIEESEAEGRGGLRIEIRDEGPGLPESELEQVFRPFYRLDPSRNRSTGGVGLGLSIARTILHSHGGTITLSNHPEGGAVAVITLPG
jgi:signal transduction histidine kinase